MYIMRSLLAMALAAAASAIVCKSCPTGDGVPTAVAGHVCISGAGDGAILGNTMDPTCAAGECDPNEAKLTQSDCEAAGGMWYPITCESAVAAWGEIETQETCAVAACAFHALMVLQNGGTNPCCGGTDPADTCDPDSTPIAPAAVACPLASPCAASLSRRLAEADTPGLRLGLG